MAEMRNTCPTMAWLCQMARKFGVLAYLLDLPLTEGGLDQEDFQEIKVMMFKSITDGEELVALEAEERKILEDFGDYVIIILRWYELCTVLLLI